MSVHLKKEIDKLNRLIMTLAGEVEKNLNDAITSVKNFDGDLALKVVENDRRIDSLEVEAEEECLKTLALYQPVANDLRYIITVLKMNNDLERIGDLAANIANALKPLLRNECPEFKVPAEIFEMGDKVRAMLRNSLNALVNQDTVQANAVCHADTEVDKLYYEMYNLVSKEGKKDPDSIPCLLQTLIIARYLERIADHTTNISEDVIYLVRGQISRHNRLPE